MSLCVLLVFWRTAKTAVFGRDVFNTYASVQEYQQEHKDIFPENHDYSVLTLILKPSKTYIDRKFCKEAKTIMVVDIWLNYVIFILTFSSSSLESLWPKLFWITE